MAPTTSTKEKPTRKGRPPKEKEGAQEKPQKVKKSAAKTKTVDEVPPKKKAASTTTKTKQVTEAKQQVESENGTATKKRTGRSTRTKVEDTEKPEELPGTSQVKEKAQRGKRGKKEDPEEVIENPDAQSNTVKAPTKKTTKRKAQKLDDEPETEKKTKPGTRVNATNTNWDSINFNCSSTTPTGKTTNFHIISWNVDGLRAWMKKGGLDLLKYDEPDILCLQETKCSEDKLPEEINNVKGYESIWCSSDRDGYAGVGLLTKIKPLSVTYGINSPEHDDEGRCITVEYKHFFLVNVYVPNAGRKLVTLPKRLEWNNIFKTHIKDLDKKKPVIICGDMNVAHTEIDLANPKSNTKNAGFTVEEREGMTDFLSDGYVDTFRKLYPDKEKAYTFWTYMANARAKNVGWRLDYFIVSERLLDNVCDNVILHEALGSDHCPITLHINI